MKRTTIRFTAMLIIVLAQQISISLALAQAPEKMSYQSVIRNASGILVKSLPVGIRVSILQTTSTGTAVFIETYIKTTNANGLVSLEIGMGTPVTGTFAAIDWAAGPYFIKTETDPLGGTAYTITGTSQLMSVPYAMYAKTAGNNPWTVSGNNIYNSNSGNVGIGVTTPTNSLTISRPIGSNSSLSLGDDDVTHGVTTLSATNDWLLVNEHSATKGGAQLTGFSDASDNPAIELKGVNVSDPDLNIPAIVLDAYSANGTGVKALAAAKTVLQMQNNGTALVSLLGNGNVGIGTTTPACKLDVAGAINGTSVFINGIAVGAGGSQWVSGSGGVISYNGGSVGIGTTAPIAKLQVNGNTHIVNSIEYSGLSLQNTYGSASLQSINYIDFRNETNIPTTHLFNYNEVDGSSNLDFGTTSAGARTTDRRVTKMRITGSGNVGIGTSVPDQKFVVYNGSTYGKYTTTGWTHSSDIRLKENIFPISGVLSSLVKLQGVRFNFINDHDKINQIGFIAQDFEKVFPEFVVSDEKGYKSIAYGEVSVVIVEAIKEQQNQIKEQQTQITQQQTQINELILQIKKLQVK